MCARVDADLARGVGDPAPRAGTAHDEERVVVAEAQLTTAERNVAGAREILDDDDVRSCLLERAVDFEQAPEVSWVDADVTGWQHVHSNAPAAIDLGPRRFDGPRWQAEVHDVDLVPEACERDREVRKDGAEAAALNAAQLVGDKCDPPSAHAPERCTSRLGLVQEALIASPPR